MHYLLSCCSVPRSVNEGELSITRFLLILEVLVVSLGVLVQLFPSVSPGRQLLVTQALLSLITVPQCCTTVAWVSWHQISWSLNFGVSSGP